MSIRSGKMRHRVKFQTRASGQDTTGDPLLQWTTFLECFASIDPPLSRRALVGREFFASQETHARQLTRFRLRYHAGILPKMRILWEERVYDVSDVQLPGGIHHEMVVMAEEIIAEAP